MRNGNPHDDEQHPTNTATETRILWHTPDKPNDISVGRDRIAAELRSRGADVTVRGTTIATVRDSLTEIGQYDALIGTTRSGALFGLLPRIARKVPLIVDHVDPIRQFHETCSNRAIATTVEIGENIALRTADAALYVYDEEAERVHGRADGAIQTRLPVGDVHFEPPSQAAIEAADGVVPDAENLAVYIGGLEPVYNLTNLFGAMAELDDWELLVLGAGSLEPTVSAVSTERSDIHYEGTVDSATIPAVLDRADVGVSLVDDPHTLKVLEYLAAGLPVVQVGGRSNRVLGEYTTACTLYPPSIADAIRSASVASGGRAYAKQHLAESVAADYAQAVVRATSDGSPWGGE